jgi:four helix bundle protein
MAHSHEDLDVWKHAMDLVDVIYTITKTIPPSERFGLISQMQRAAVSVPANIAEGCVRESTKDLLRLLAIAQGSLAELRTLLLIAERQSFIHRDQLGGILDRSNTVAKLLMGFRKSLRRKLDG